MGAQQCRGLRREVSSACHPRKSPNVRAAYGCLGGDDEHNHHHDILFSIIKTTEAHAKKSCHPVQYIPPFRRREDLAFILAAENKTVAAELGVKEGDFASDIINRWKSAKKYVLVDYWAHQDNYVDGANVPNAVHNEFYKYAMNLMKLVKDKGFVQEVEVCRNFTNVCVHNYESSTFDFIYVDARHDYKGALQDIRQWWPKLKVGGIMAGHDYMLKSEVDEANKNWKGPKDDWSINFDGTINERTVRGAVDDFFSDRFGDMKGCPRQATISYRETAFHTWAVRK